MRYLVVGLALLLPLVASADSVRISDKQIRKLLIEESIAAYDGNCPCPYNLARNGSRCGKRSAYDREGGEAPLCFERDVSDEMVAEYRRMQESQ